MSEKEEPKGFTCECGTFATFGAYVFAHWTDSLTHTCPDCKAQHNVYKGKATLIGAKRGKRKV